MFTGHYQVIDLIWLIMRNHFIISLWKSNLLPEKQSSASINEIKVEASTNELTTLTTYPNRDTVLICV